MIDLPLASLRALEAAARNRSYSAAARELNVTHAAIAQHVRKLETRFQTKLMQRAGQQMEPTPDGAMLLEGLTEGFSRISQSVAAFAARHEEKPLALTTTHTFAEHWLLPRLGAFMMAHPEIKVSVSPDHAVSDLRRDGFDMAIRYGDGNWPGLDSEFLAPADPLVLAAPSYLKAQDVRLPVKSLAELDHLHWAFFAGYLDYRRWAEAHGLTKSPAHWTDFLDVSHTLTAARSGYALAIQPRAVVEGDLASGSLQVVYEESRPDVGYHIVTVPGTFSKKRDTFIRWLKRHR